MCSPCHDPFFRLPAAIGVFVEFFLASCFDKRTPTLWGGVVHLGLVFSIHAEEFNHVSSKVLESEDCRIVRTRWIGNHAATRLYSGCGQWKWAWENIWNHLHFHMLSFWLYQAAHAHTSTSQLPSKAAKKKCVQRLFTRSSPGDQSSCGWPPKIIWMPPQTTIAEGAGHSFKKTC